jgi:SAM-dependent methyltransferase
MRYEPLDWYDNALYYDIVFDTGTAAEADFLDAVAGRYGRSRGSRALEPACGSGRLVAALARRGWRVAGFDRSPGMLAFARRRLGRERLHARLTRGRMERFGVPGKFDLAHCLVSTFKYLRDEDSARSHLRCVAGALATGGVYVLGLHLADYGARGPSHERWVASRNGIRVTSNIRCWPPHPRRRTERVRSRLLVRARGKERRFETEWTFRSYDARQLRRLLRRVPEFEHVATHDFNHDIERTIPLDGEQLDAVLVLRKR